MALVSCILDKFFGVVCHCFPSPLDVPTFAARCLHVGNDARTMGEKCCPGILSTWRFNSRHYGSFTCNKSTTWDRRLYFPFEGRRAEDFFALKNPTASVGFERANLGNKGQDATPRPPKPLNLLTAYN
jgi:hypothetical protein